MTIPLIFMFSGQGSHYYQMGKQLFVENKTFRQILLNADKHYQALTMFSLIDQLYHPSNPPEKLFTRTLLTHPAIFICEYALLNIFLEHDIQPQCVLGYSMGEFAAATAAGMIHFEDALTAVIKQAQLLEQYCETAGMLAILGAPQLYYELDSMQHHTELAAINFPEHFVVSGKKEHLDTLQAQLKTRQIASQLLPVSYGFHSTLIDNAEIPFLHFMESIPLHDAQLPLISCADNETHFNLPKHHFWDCIHNPVQFQQVIQRIEKHHPAIYLDLGPSGTLATFVKYNLSPASRSSTLAMLSPSSANLIDVLEKIKQQIDNF